MKKVLIALVAGIIITLLTFLFSSDFVIDNCAGLTRDDSGSLINEQGFVAPQPCKLTFDAFGWPLPYVRDNVSAWYEGGAFNPSPTLIDLFKETFIYPEGRLQGVYKFDFIYIYKNLFIDILLYTIIVYLMLFGLQRVFPRKKSQSPPSS